MAIITITIISIYFETILWVLQSWHCDPPFSCRVALNLSYGLMLRILSSVTQTHTLSPKSLLFP